MILTPLALPYERPTTDYRTYIGMAGAFLFLVGIVVAGFKVRDAGVRVVIQIGCMVAFLMFAVLLWFVFPPMPI